MTGSETDETFDLVARAARERSISVVAVEHNVPVIQRFSDRILVLNFGSVIADDLPDVVLRNNEVVEAYLGHRA
jgi:ABC-type branched-subunit amino acid transport system ATPase component